MEAVSWPGMGGMMPDLAGGGKPEQMGGEHKMWGFTYPASPQVV